MIVLVGTSKAPAALVLVYTFSAPQWMTQASRTIAHEDVGLKAARSHLPKSTSKSAGRSSHCLRTPAVYPELNWQR